MRHHTIRSDRDWLEGGRARFSKTQKCGVTGHFQNVVVHQFCIKSFLFVYPSVLNALQTTAFPNCFQMPRARGICCTSKAQLKNRKGHHAGRKSEDLNTFQAVWLMNTILVSKLSEDECFLQLLRKKHNISCCTVYCWKCLTKYGRKGYRNAKW